MTNTQFKIGEIVKDTQGYGNVIVKDIFRSTTNEDWFCYRVEDELKPSQSFLVNEEELLNTNDQSEWLQ